MSYKILIVDDEPDLELLVRQKFRKHIRERKFEFSFAGNGQEALDKLDQDKEIDLVLSDINMPVMDGLTFLGRLEGIERLLKAVIVSAYGDMQNIRTAMNRGAFDFVTKPIDFDDLEITINKTIQAINHLKQAERERAQLISIQQELTVAARIQLSILPRSFPPFPERRDFEIFAEILPAKEVGGDFYDFFLIDNDRLGIVIGDVSGKGVPAAILMAVTRTLLHATALKKSSPNDCMDYVNDILVGQSDPSMFVTVFYGILNTRTGELEYCIAGHNPPYVFSAGSVRSLDVPPGRIMGVIPNSNYRTHQAQLRAGDTVLLYTDGVTEAINTSDSFFSEERLVEWFQRSGGLPVEEVVSGLVGEVQAFAGGHAQADDVTVLAIRYLG
ncbi:MAG TPA: SpoIIE family protein phosphatase [Terriglobia bacterium]|nr:SpoIIE family protein phosphatase [Terriglobia bacterium]